jgi:hypothetical protein
MQRYANNITTQSGQAVPGAIVTVLNYPAMTPATIYSDNASTAQANPIKTDKLGFFAFYAADGRYSLAVSGRGIASYQLDDFLLEDQLYLDNGSAADAGALTGSENALVNRGAGVLQTTLTKIAQWVIQTYQGFTQSGTGAVARTVQDELRDWVKVKQFGAKGDGTTDDSAALAAADAIGATYFTSGVYYIGANTTFTSKTYFGAGASLKIASGVTVTFNERIDAARQNLFTFIGTAAVLLSGEGSHAVYPEWFGVFPNRSSVDAAPLLQTLSNSVIAGRECFIPFAAGTYYLNGVVNWSRACRVLGEGERLTHFRCMSTFSAGDVFTTQDQGVTFENLQFSSATTPRTSGRYIALLTNYCKAKNIWHTDGFIGVEAVGNDCDIDQVQAFTHSSAAGSCVVKLPNNSFRARVTNIKMLESAGSNKPENIVRVEAASDFYVDHVSGAGAGVAGVAVVPSSGTASGGQIDNVNINGNAVNALLINTTGTGAIDGLQVGKIKAKALSGEGVKVQKDGSGILKYMEFEQIDATTCAVGFKVASSNGFVDHWKLKGGFARSCTGNGYDLSSARYFQMSDTMSVSNGGTGTLIASGCVNFVYAENENLFNTTAQLTDNSGAVTKQVANNI